MQKIFVFLVIFASYISANPWYEYADNELVDTIIEEQFKPECPDQQSLARMILKYARHVENNIFPALVKEQKIDELEVSRRNYLALLIKASDLGFNVAKGALVFLLNEGKYGVDQDLSAAKRFFKEQYYEYIEPKPWYEYLGSDEDHELIKNYANFSKSQRAKGLYLNAKFNLLKLESDLAAKERAKMAQSMIFLLVRASELGSKEAMIQLATILHEGSHGVKRDNEFATMLECEVGISKLIGFESFVAQNYLLFVKDFHYNPISRILEVSYDEKCVYYYGGEAENLARIYGYLKKKTSYEAEIDKCLKLMSHQLKNLESVD